MLVKCKGTPNRNAWYHDKAEWIFEVESETTDNILGYQCDERYVLTKSQVAKLREKFGVCNTEYLPVSDADVVEIGEDDSDIDEHNCYQALFNVAEVHGFDMYLEYIERKKDKEG